MREILDIDEIPEKIGETEIVFAPHKKDTYNRIIENYPLRKGKTIILPEDEDDIRFYHFEERGQFLATMGLNQEDRRLFFGGMDESPFLVELHFSILENLINGEEAFFESLKPKVVREWEKTLKTPARRQGDFFAVPFFKTDWGVFFRQNLGKAKVEVSLVEEMPLRNTRHSLKGLVALNNGVNGGIIIGEGEITAPDHESIMLRGPHLIEQAVGFVRPKEAD